MTEGIALADRIAHPFSREISLQYAALLHSHRGEPELARRRLGEAERLAAEQRVAFIMEPRFVHGAAYIAQGAADEAIVCIRDGLVHWKSIGGTAWLPYSFCLLAEALRQNGDFGQALAALDEGLKTIEATGEHMWDAELHRVNGLVLVAENQLDEGQARLKQAIQIARQQKAKSLELRAATGLARLWGEQGRRAEARDLLAPVYRWFTEGFDTADLKEAAALLSELR